MRAASHLAEFPFLSSDFDSAHLDPLGKVLVRFGSRGFSRGFISRQVNFVILGLAVFTGLFVEIPCST
jgi:hypothetical protein